MEYKKKARLTHERSDLFDGLPDDVVISIICNVSSTARCPSDLINILITCKRLNKLGLHPLVLAKAGRKTLAIRAKNWSEYAHRFLKRCVCAGNVEAAYYLGMIQFYCLQNYRSGASLMSGAATQYYTPALYSLGLIQFNGSGYLTKGKNLRAGVALCARASFFGHIDALREIGHCLKEGYGVSKNVEEGRKLLVRANAQELMSVLRALNLLSWQPDNELQTKLIRSNSDPESSVCSALWSDYGCNVPPREPHPANRFLVEWFGLRGGAPGEGLNMCSHTSCGRPEIRKGEFRKCVGCGKANYCSRACQAHDWKMRHKAKCAPMQQWRNWNPPAMDEEDEEEEDDDDGDDDDDDQTVEVEEGVGEGGASG